jgi:ParB family transcriptional regulator, chromosome partitioning protein
VRPQVVRVQDLRPNPENPRRDVGDVTELAGSIKRLGLLQPLLVQSEPDGSLMILDGHRRAAAAKLAGLDRLPAVVVPDSDVDVQIGRMCAAAMHKALAPVELGAAFARLRDTFGLDHRQIAQRTGYSIKTVKDRLWLLELPADVRRMVEEGRLPAADGAALARDVKKHGRGAARLDRPSRWFTSKHPLARVARGLCGSHPDRRTIIGSVACGACWEAAIRADESEEGRSAA